MSATPIGVDPTPVSSEDAVRRQLDALANGECDHVTFLNNMKERFRFEPDDNWEVLSLLDQYYRRGKITLEVFRALKSGFAEYILGPQNSTPSPRVVTQPSTPSPQVIAPTLHTVVTPTPANPATAASSAPLASAPAASAAAAPAPAKASFFPSPFDTVPISAAAAAGASAAAAAPAPTREAHVGDVLRNRYRIEAIVAKGASGCVFEASDPYRLNQPPAGKRVAVKVMRTPDPRGVFMSQLRQEFHYLQMLSHPNIVRAFDFDRDGTLAFFTMELLHGVHLNRALQSRGGVALQRALALAIIRDIGAAIAYAHSRGVAHGDINPQNVFITMGGELRVLGFGAAHKLSPNTPAPEFEHASAFSDTHKYASCEVFQGTRPDASDDLYSLSCLAYLLLNGKHPFSERTSIEARAERLRPRRPARLTYRQWLTLRAGLQTDRNKRPTDVQAWLDAMELGGAARRLPAANELTETPADKPRRLRLAAGVVLIGAFLAGAYWLATNVEIPRTQPAAEPAAQDLAPTPPPAPPPVVSPPVRQAPPQAQTTTPRPSVKPPAPQPAAPAAPTSARAAAAPKTESSPASAAAAHAAPIAARVEMVADTLDALPTDTVVHVTVRRKGSLRGETGFTWWTESGTAKPGTDFAPVLPHVEHMQDGEASVVLTVRLIPMVRALSKGFYVGIEQADGGAQIGARALTQITLPATN